MAFGAILDWQAESVAVSLFVPSHPDMHISNIYREAFDREPTQTNENVQPIGRIGQAAAASNDRTRVLSLQPGRIDISLNGSDINFSPLTNHPPTLPNIEEAIDEAVRASSKVLKHTSHIQRTALNIRLVKYNKTTVEANREILSVLPFKIRLEEETDFLLQVNKPSRVAGMAVNRIMRWSVENLQFVTSTSPLGGAFQYTPQTMQQYFSAILHMDFNTVPTNIMLQPDQVASVLADLASEVLKSRKNGLKLS